MRALLDTHAFLWWLYDSARLSARAREILADESNILLLSSASVWELIIKIQSGKLRIPEEPEHFVATRLALHSMDSLSVKLEHSLRVYTLPGHHKDPFDRMLVAQALWEGLPIITAVTAWRRCRYGEVRFLSRGCNLSGDLRRSLGRLKPRAG
jgi:PIN domain nuclease of toxin-antitoxin system